ncbi:MAG: hypothetical protein IJX22_02445 [Opitutales bacterium]|nr:hypothetical protein [Opitutales bacterium]
METPRRSRPENGRRLNPLASAALTLDIVRTSEPYSALARKYGVSHQRVSAFAKRIGIEPKLRRATLPKSAPSFLPKKSKFEL